VQAGGGVEPAQGMRGIEAFEASVSDEPTDNRSVFLFDLGLIFL
jgi:hypothetical protein